MAKIKKNDIVKILTGKDSGKTGKVFAVLSKGERAMVQGLNLVTKHTKRTREDQQGGIIKKESPVHISNLMVICQKCGNATRTGFSTLSDGTKVRICKKCKELL